MLTYPTIDPTLFSIGPLTIHWYGFMYFIGFVFALMLGHYRARQPHSPWQPDQVSDLIFYCIFGLILGARIGYMLFYYRPDPQMADMQMWEFWKGGMSFHGGFIGVAIAMWIFSLKIKKSLFYVSDFVAPLVPFGLAAGRLGNFINGELVGRPTDMPWGMVFPFIDGQPRHPSQLYELALEGIVLFIIVWFFSRKPRPQMAVSGVFLVGYGVFRFFVEFFRTPDAQLGFIAFEWLTMGQLLTVPMVALGLILLWLAYNRSAKPAESESA